MKNNTAFGPLMGIVVVPIVVDAIRRGRTRDGSAHVFPSKTRMILPKKKKCDIGYFAYKRVKREIFLFYKLLLNV